VLDRSFRLRLVALSLACSEGQKKVVRKAPVVRFHSLERVPKGLLAAVYLDNINSFISWLLLRSSCSNGPGFDLSAVMMI
jgi:hypothetical protein